MATRSFDVTDHPRGGDLWEAWETGATVDFESEAAERRYRERTARYRAAIELREVDRPPVQLGADFLAAHLADASFEDLLYDADAALRANRAFLDAFDPDANPLIPLPSGRMLDRLGYRLYDWPGDGLGPDQAYQAREDEYMQPDEYDELVANPEGFLLRTYYPRVFSALEGLADLPQLMGAIELPMLGPMMLPFGTPALQESLRALLEAGEEQLRWQQQVGAVTDEAHARGYPTVWGGFSKAPFDTIGDTLRGTRGVMVDMRRRPEDLKEACEALVPQMVEMAVTAAHATGVPMVLFVLHKGADGFMSNDDYREFYWPSLKRTVQGVMDEGIVPWFFAEGSYEDRLEIVANDHPDGPAVWYFDKTDMALAKEHLGDRAAIAGNVPTDVIKTGTPERVRAYCEDLLETVGPTGFILAPGVVVYRAPPENLRAIVDAVA